MEESDFGFFCATIRALVKKQIIAFYRRIVGRQLVMGLPSFDNQKISEITAYTVCRASPIHIPAESHPETLYS